MELDREEIIKALECCKSPKLTKCDGCPREQDDGHCMYRLNEDALALIKELAEENEKLNKLLEHCEDDGEYWKGKYNNAVADTVRKMQERLKMCFGTYVLGYKIPLTETLKIIDQIAKEMLEGDTE